jgi:acetamidase/formamidase
VLSQGAGTSPDVPGVRIRSGGFPGVITTAPGPAPLTNLSEDITLATRDVLLQMIDYLVNVRGFTRDQAYIICSVAVDLHFSNVVGIPNTAVHAVLPLEIFRNRSP